MYRPIWTRPADRATSLSTMCPVPSEHVISGAGSRALAIGRLLAAAEAVGGAQDCLEAAVGYAKVREQFGRTIGTFQAIKHHLANMLVGSEAAVSTVWDAARATDNDEQFQLMAGCAATLAIPAYMRNAELNTQVHGGIGFTWEHDAHLHLRRATTLRALFGGNGPAHDVFALSREGRHSRELHRPSAGSRNPARTSSGGGCGVNRTRRSRAPRTADRNRISDAPLAQTVGSRRGRGGAIGYRGGFLRPTASSDQT